MAARIGQSCLVEVLSTTISDNERIAAITLNLGSSSELPIGGGVAPLLDILFARAICIWWALELGRHHPTPPVPNL
ncbi:MAG: hypothetical protein QF834_00695 [Candidatus Thalassarchaeaceae archaeon]|nr:hypothetical protein [Candidatus Thalassarchaeaceae archaeon]